MHGLMGMEIKVGSGDNMTKLQTQIVLMVWVAFLFILHPLKKRMPLVR